MQEKLEKLDACPICGGLQSEKYLQCIDYSVSQEKFTLVQCLTCTFIYTNPRPDQKHISTYYQSTNYISHTDTDKGLINKVYHRVRQKTLSDKLKLVNRIHLKGKLLDIGCGTGAFLEVCERSGWLVKGTEPDAGARAIAQKKIKSYIEEDFLEALEEEKFDVITLWHVLEHIHQLNRALEKINKLLANRGKLVIAVPNVQSYDAKYFKQYWAAYDPPRHLYHFSKKTLEILMNKHGIKLDEIIPMKFDAYYIGLLSTKNKFNRINYAKGVIQGLKSNYWARQNQDNYSSLTYIFSR